jgi:hypothetical protein
MADPSVGCRPRLRDRLDRPTLRAPAADPVNDRETVLGDGLQPIGPAVDERLCLL